MSEFFSQESSSGHGPSIFPMKKIHILLIVIVAGILVSSGIINQFTGKAVFTRSYSVQVDKQFTESGVYLWQAPENITIKDIRIDGQVYGTGEVKITAIHDGRQQLLYKRSSDN